MGIISLSLGILGFVSIFPAIISYDILITVFAIGISFASIVTGIISIIQKSYRASGIIGLVLGSITCTLALLCILIPLGLVVYFFIWLIASLS